MVASEEYLLEVLQETGLVMPGDIAKATAQKQGRESVIDTLVRLNIITPEDVTRSLAYQANMDFVDLREFKPSQEAVDLVPADVAQRYKLAPIKIEGGSLMIAVSDPLDFETLDSLPHVLNYPLEVVCASREQIDAVLIQFYGSAEKAVRQLEGSAGEEAGIAVIDQGTGDISADEEDPNAAPIIKMVSSMLLEAFRARSSDIHIEPMEKYVRIRYRIDGVLHKVHEHPKKLLSSIIARIKIMTGTISIAEKRLPQDGRIQVKMGDKEMDLRVSTVPTNHGESVVMRILDKSSLLLGLPQLGFLTDDQETFENLIGLPDGIILVTGPTGSGKTTTLYACLNHINKPDRKIITVEDPIEYQLGGINQVMVKESIGMTFAAALRAILRQAPNIIMIGEIRDIETAEIAIQASLTGHLVFSTLHTNDAPSAVARLSDIGIKPFLTASAVRAIIAQRLVRKLCGECAESSDLNEQQMRALHVSESQLPEAHIMDAIGCSNCRGTGFRGRMGLFEVFEIDDEVRHMINEQLSTPMLRRRARELGMRTLREDGIRKVLSGMTTADEVIHVTMSDRD